VPHGWDAGLLMDVSNGTLLCGDLFTQGGRGEISQAVQALVESPPRQLTFYPGVIDSLI